MGEMADVEGRIDTESDGGAAPGGVEAPTTSDVELPAEAGVLDTEHRPVAPSEPAVLSRNRTRLAVLGGARASVLNKVPEEADRFTQMLPLLLATAVLSGVSMAFAVATGVLPNEPLAWFVAIPVAVLWAALIFIVDRALTSSMKSTKSRGRLAMAAAPRILLAALIGVVVSGPLVLQIFANDINQEMVNINLEQGTTQTEQLGEGPAKERLDRAREELNALRQQAQTGLIDGVESASQSTIDARERVTTLQEQVEAQRVRLAKATALFVCERNGKPPVEGCTGQAGQGDGYARAVAAMKREEAAFDQLSRQLEDAQGALAAAEEGDATNTESAAATNRAEAEASLPVAQTEYDEALAAYTALSKKVNDANAGAIGLIAQIRALEHLQAREVSVMFLHWAIAALFFAIELMPVMVKMFRSYGDPNPYELAEEAESVFASAQFRHNSHVQTDQLDHERALQLDSLEHERAEERRGFEARSQAVRAVEQDMLDREVRIGIEQNERVASQMQVVVGQALDQWQLEVQRVFEQGQAQLGPDADRGYLPTISAGSR